MSETYSIACKDCQKHLWIAQGRIPLRGHIYTSEAHLKSFFEFLSEHMGHSLIFGDNCEEPIVEYSEIEKDEN